MALDNAGGMTVLVDHLALEHGHRGSRTSARRRPWAPAARPRARAANGSRRSGPRSGGAGSRSRPSTCDSPSHALWQEEARASTAELLALPEPPTAIVAGVDLLALGVLRGLRDGGRRVPDDVAVVSFDEPGFADLLDPPVTSLDRHDREIGRRAARLLLDALDGADGRPAAVERVSLTLHARRSCGCEG